MQDRPQSVLDVYTRVQGFYMFLLLLFFTIMDDNGRSSLLVWTRLNKGRSPNQSGKPNANGPNQKPTLGGSYRCQLLKPQGAKVSPWLRRWRKPNPNPKPRSERSERSLQSQLPKAKEEQRLRQQLGSVRIHFVLTARSYRNSIVIVEDGCRHRHGVLTLDGFEAQVAPDVRARLPFQALCLKLAGQMPVMLIRSLVSKGVIPPEMGFGPAAPAPMSLEELRQKTQETVTGALQQIQGWRDRAELMQCLNSVIPLERLS
jgi:hypothetical protein